MPRVALQEGPVKLPGVKPGPLGEVGPEEEGQGLLPSLQILQGLLEVPALVQAEGPVVGALAPR